MRYPIGTTLALMLSMTPMAATSAEQLFVAGKARVVSGNVIEIWEHRIRLWGITVPDPASRPGRLATSHLHRLLDGVTVRCETVGILSFDHMIARCLVGEIDIAEALVVSGHAVDLPVESGGYYALRD